MSYIWRSDSEKTAKLTDLSLQQRMRVSNALATVWIKDYAVGYNKSPASYVRHHVQSRVKEQFSEQESQIACAGESFTAAYFYTNFLQFRAPGDFISDKCACFFPNNKIIQKWRENRLERQKSKDGSMSGILKLLFPNASDPAFKRACRDSSQNYGLPKLHFEGFEKWERVQSFFSPNGTWILPFGIRKNYQELLLPENKMMLCPDNFPMGRHFLTPGQLVFQTCASLAFFWMAFSSFKDVDSHWNKHKENVKAQNFLSTKHRRTVRSRDLARLVARATVYNAFNVVPLTMLLLAGPVYSVYSARGSEPIQPTSVSTGSMGLACLMSYFLYNRAGSIFGTAGDIRKRIIDLQKPRDRQAKLNFRQKKLTRFVEKFANPAGRGKSALLIGGLATVCVSWKYFVAFMLNWSVIHAKVIEQYSVTEETTENINLTEMLLRLREVNDYFPTNFKGYFIGRSDVHSGSGLWNYWNTGSFMKTVVGTEDEPMLKDAFVRIKHLQDLNQLVQHLFPDDETFEKDITKTAAGKFYLELEK